VRHQREKGRRETGPRKVFCLVRSIGKRGENGCRSSADELMGKKLRNRQKGKMKRKYGMLGREKNPRYSKGCGASDARTRVWELEKLR